MRAPAALLALAFLAGCAAPPTPADGTAEAAGPVLGPRVLDWSQAECEAITWSVPVTAAALQPHLPSGFEPSPPEASPAPASPGVAGAATLGFRAVECNYGFGEAKVLRSMQSGLLFTPVLPPAELREERFASHYAFGWDLLVASESWRAAARPWGLPVGDGGAMVGPTAQGWTGSLAIDGVGAFSMTGRPFDKGQPAAGFEARTITGGSQGFALWDSETANRTVSTGVGTWTVSPESWVATVLGATSGLATFEHATFDLPSAWVHWPGQALGPMEDDAGLRPADLVPPPPSPAAGPSTPAVPRA
jgi:hypothetical protein